ncbi:protein translocase SecG subunit [Rhizobium redzepovicii]
MQTVLIVIHLMIVLALVGVVLIQRSEGGGLGIGGGSGFMSARGTANALTRTTAILATLFFITSLGLGILTRYQGRPSDILDRIPATGRRPGQRHSRFARRRRAASGKPAGRQRRSEQRRGSACTAGSRRSTSGNWRSGNDRSGGSGCQRTFSDGSGNGCPGSARYSGRAGTGSARRRPDGTVNRSST